jgi:DNA gyrase subunit A
MSEDPNNNSNPNSTPDPTNQASPNSSDSPNPQNPPSGNQNIFEKDIKTELSTSYIDYAMSVIVGRAIADVRDGLKPVHRRILYSMAENNFFHNQPHRKCARIVGDVLGRYHPHGDQSVYDALVRLAQDFSVRYPLIDGQGNFGSVDGDPPAAMRYTEARLQQISEELLSDIDKNTVDMLDNFDGSLKEPAYLPAKLPNLLLNGVSGIAVGMSTNMAPHNLREVCAAIVAAIDKGFEKITPDDIIPYIKGPDFPTGGIIMGRNGILDAIRTGRGSINLRAKCEIHAGGSGNKKDRIIVTEIPYQVNKAHLIESIAELIAKDVIPEIADVRDESDREGMTINIELKKNSDANAVLNRLYLKTQMQISFGIINLVLINNGKQPVILNYADLIKEFITHRIDVIRRRTTFDLNKAEKRLHLVLGLLIAIDHIDEIVALIKKSANPGEAEEKLIQNYALDSLQAQEILKMPLSRLTNLQTQKLIEEKDELNALIAELKSILADRNKILKIIKTETEELAKKYGDERRSEIQDIVTAESTISLAETIPEEECVIMITENQAIKRMTLENYQTQRRGGKGKKGMQIREEDLIQNMFTSSSHDTILLFTQAGRAYSLPAYLIPLSSRTAKGKAIVNYVKIQPDEKIIDIINISDFNETATLIFISEKGTIKKTDLNQFANIRSNGINCMNIREDDLLVKVKLCHPNDHVIIATKNGYALHFIESELRSMGRTAMGVRGIKLRTENDRVIDLVVCKEDENLLTITKNGFGKISSVELYRLTHRGGKGIINIKLREESDEVIAIKAITAEENLLLASSQGQIIRIQASGIRETGRAAKGVIVMKLAENDFISSVALCEGECVSEIPQGDIETLEGETIDESDESEEEDSEDDEENDNNIEEEKSNKPNPKNKQKKDTSSGE